MKYRIATVFALVCLFVSVASASTLSVPAGYKAEVYLTLSQGTFVGGFDVDASGNVYAFETQYEYDAGYYNASTSLLNKYDLSGGITTTLHDFDDLVWGAFVKVNGDEVVFGESSDNVIRSISKYGGIASEVYTLPGQYDIAYNSLGEMFVSANPGGFGSGDNVIYHIYDDGLGLVCDEIVYTDGYSGPIAFDDDDNLYYGFGSGQIVKIAAADIASAIATGDLGNAELGSADWSTYCDGLAGCAYLRFDGDGDLFSTSYAATIETILGQDLLAGFGVVSNDTTMSFLGQMTFIPGLQDFEPGNADGGTLYVLVSDFDYNNGEYASAIYAITPTATAVPEPSTIVMILGGLLASGGCVARRMKK